MEAAAAFAVACNILQIVDKSCAIVKTAKEIRGSMNGMTSEHENLFKSAEQLHGMAMDLQHRDDKLRETAGRWKAAFDNHMALLSILSLTESNWYPQAIWVAVRVTLKKEKLDQSQANIARLAAELNTYLCAVYLPSISDKLVVFDDDLVALDGKMERGMAAVGQELKRIEAIAQGTSDTANKAKDPIGQPPLWLAQQREQRLDYQCLHALYFKEFDTRHGHVTIAHVETIGWILDAHIISSSVEDQGKFREWLHSGVFKKNVFWISGKPGADKSTLMKYIALQGELQSWGGAVPIIIEFYFWRHGASLQRSSNGLLRSLLYQVLKAHPVLLHNAFPKRSWVSGGSKFEFGQDSL